MFCSFVFSCLYLSSLVGVFADSGLEKSVMEGDSVTLDSGVAELQAKDVVKWNFGNEKTRIARINKEAKLVSTSDGDSVGFRDRLNLDNQTGSLTIMNTRTADSGSYHLIISGQTSIKCTFNVNVYATTINPSPTPSPTTGSSKCEHLNITELCQKSVLVSGWGSAEAVLRLVTTSLMAMAAAAAVVLLVYDIRSTRASMMKTGDL